MIAAGFTLRRIRTVQTLGEKMRRARKRKGIDLVEAELATKIRAKYLEALESGDFELLPNDVYVKGFLTVYAQYLGLDPNKVEELYDMEKSARRLDDPELFSSSKPIKERALIFTPKLAVIIFAVLFCISAVIYIIFQVLSFASVPRLAIDSPSKDMVTESEAIKVVGTTDPGVNLNINKEPISLTSDGKFQQEISLQKGLNTIVISAKNKANKESSKVFVVERKTKTAENISK